MGKKVLVMLGFGMSVFVLSELSFAGINHTPPQLTAGDTSHQQATTTASGVTDTAVNVGNKICPVSGEKVAAGDMEPVTYEYEGKIYNFCCAGCIDEFKKDPQPYIKKVEAELKAAKEAQAQAAAKQKKEQEILNFKLQKSHR